MFTYMLLFCSIATMMHSEQIAPQNIYNKFSDSLDLRTKIENVIQDLMISKQLKTFKAISNEEKESHKIKENGTPANILAAAKTRFVQCSKANF
ncbi:hypothetical protein T11_14639 [Trichinella zimbabwensis]|uniref:Uncharacterized protein n=1 Tax=Trichinella zimbabwensis TaxID=268475 RepID=A0A0V1HY12_9BILA|nr:hypothetical protein T11_14639 [Trichinella zimbabwensis]